jgi:hypothetical protein
MARKKLFLLACLLILSSPPLRADDTNLVMRRYPIQPSFADVVMDTQDEFSAYTNRPPGVPGKKEVTAFLEKCGVPFPPGTYAAYSEDVNTLIHYNTIANQKILGRIIITDPGRPMQVQIDAVFVDFPRSDIERLCRAGNNPLPRSEDLLQLWKDGHGTLLHAIKLMTRSGINSQIQAVSELISFTEFTPAATNAADAATSPLPVPGGFETREAGAIFNATPTVAPDGQTIDVVLAPELTTKPEWQSLSITGTDAQGRAIQLSAPLPVFHVRNITTCIVVHDGKTAVLGGMENPAGDGFTYLFLTVTLLDSRSRQWNDYAGEEPELEE